jgi:hypothetical protein
VVVEKGERFFIRCDGGPSVSRLATYPPPLEVQEADGMYVLIDDGPVEEWSYTFIAGD